MKSKKEISKMSLPELLKELDLVAQTSAATQTELDKINREIQEFMNREQT